MAMSMCTCVCGGYNDCVIKSKTPTLKWPNLILLMLAVIGKAIVLYDTSVRWEARYGKQIV